MMHGRLIIFSAPSGAGKTTIVHRLLKSGLPLEFSVSACTREPREGEINGKDYFFISLKSFKEKIKKKDFVEWEEVYAGHFYGTLKSEIERIWKQNKSVVFDVDVAGGLNLKKQFGKKALAVFVRPPSLEILEQRLRKRGTDSGSEISIRLKKARKEMTLADKFDVILVNDDLERVVKEATEIVSGFLESLT
jgi:guanylate kinase